MTIRTYCKVVALSASPHQRLMLTEAHGKNGCLLGRSYHLPLPSTLMSLWGIFQPSFSYFYFLSSIPFIHFPLRHKCVFVTVIVWHDKKQQQLGHFEKRRRWEERGSGRRKRILWKMCPFRTPQRSISVLALWSHLTVFLPLFKACQPNKELFFWVSSELHHLPWCCAYASHWTKNVFSQSYS